MPNSVLNGYLSRLAQEIDKTALVYCLESAQATTGEEWVLRRSGQADLGLGSSFNDARAAALAWMRAERAGRKQP
jgi:hypothetical protein